MKTKYAFFALCLPIAFTACQNEEFVKDYSQELKNRGEIDVILSASYPTVENSVNTRMGAEESGNNLSFLWEATTDKLGAALMDEEAPGTVNGAKIYNNYPFIAQKSGAISTFASPSSITKGIYLFYNSYKDVLNREALSLSLQNQEYDPADTKKSSAQQMVKYMNMVAPMVNLNEGIKLADAANFNLPLEFVNLYTPVKVPVKFIGAPEGTKLTKISINNGGSGFVLGGALNPKVLAGNKNANVLALTDGTIDLAKLADAKTAIEKIVQNGAGASGIYTETTAKQVRGAAELSIKNGMALTNDEVQNFWILIPRGKHATLKVNVETTNGNMAEKTIDVPASVEGTDVNPQEFTSATRELSTIELDFNTGGNVVQPYNFTVNSMTDWDNYIKYVDDHLRDYAGKTITFTIGASKTVYVTSFPEFGFTLEGAGADSKLIFGKEDKTAIAASLDLKDVKMESNVNLEVGEGATVTFKKAQTGTIASLTNNGVLIVEEIGTVTTLTNNKTLNINSAAALTLAKVDNKGEAVVNVNNGEATFTAFTNENKATINVAAKASLTLQGSANAGTIVNKGTLANADGFTNNGTIDNYGTLTVTTTYTNAGKIIAQDGSSSNNQEITNSNGTVEVKKPTTYAALDTEKKYNVNGGTETAVVTNRGDYLAAGTASLDITLDGGEWSIVADGATVGETSRELKVSEVKNLSLQSDLNVKATADLSEKDFTITGTNVTIRTAARQTLKVKSLTVAKGAAAAIAENAVVIVQNLVGDEVAVTVNGTLTNNGTLCTPTVASVGAVGEVKKFNITVAAGATLTNNGAIGGELNTQAVTTVNGNLNNNKGTIYGENKVGKAQSYTRGTVYDFASIKTTATDLSGFEGAVNIEATGAVTVIPQNTNIEFNTGTPALVLADADGNYGELTFNADASVKASAANTKISKITIGSITLTVDSEGSGESITCKDLVNNGTLTDSNKKLVKTDGAAWAE